MNKQKIVLFDIDYTLFDVSYFHKNFYKKLSRVVNKKEDKIREVSIKIISEILEEEKYLNIEKYLNRLVSILNTHKDKERIEELLFNSGFFKNGFYKDVEKTLRTLNKFAKIGIFSHGDLKLQWAKIDQSGFKDYFDKDITYIKNIKMDFLPYLKKKHLNDELYLVDDKPNVVDNVKKLMPSVFTIWLKRGKYINQAKEIKDFKPDATIGNLREVVEIVRRS